MKKIDLIVVGAGPTGIGCAVEAKLKNKEVLILEKSNNICQTLMQFYKDGKRVDKAYKDVKEPITDMFLLKMAPKKAL